MKKLLCASMMCADYKNLGKEIESLQQSGIDIFHIDVMDGKYVPNFGMGLQDIECICKLSKIPVDIHLMIENPENYVEMFANMGVDIIYFHPETCRHPARVIQTIKDCGKKAGIVLSPNITCDMVEDLIGISDYVTVMTVNPGFAGQKYLEFVTSKLEKIVKLKDKYNFTLVIDGACSKEKVMALSKIGVDGFVLGTSALFNKGIEYKKLIDDLRGEN